MATAVDRLDFDPDMVARTEASGWRAYYARHWVRAFLLLVRLVQEQFHVPFPRSLGAVFYTVRASVAFAPQENAAALDQVRADLRRFYRVVAAANAQPFDPAQAGDLELTYWMVHRQLAVAADPDKTPMVDALAALHAAVFASTPTAMRPSAVSRARAATHVDRITSHQSTDPAADWRAVYFHLRRAYEQVKEQCNAAT